ncbi:hypothetical protein ACVLVH_004716 [Kluyvera sp. 1366]
MSDVNLAVVSGKRIIQAVELSLKGNAAKIKAVPGGRYVLAEGEKLVGPENITLKRSGKNLLMMLENSSGEPQLIIENFYDHPGELVGLGEDGDWHSYVSANADTTQNPDALQDGEQSPVLLSSDNAAALEDLSVDSNGLAMGLIALGATAAVAALVVLANSSGGSDNNQDQLPTPPKTEESTDHATETATAKATVDAIHDDVGEKQGVILPGETSDDNLPTLSGDKQSAGSLIEVRDNGVVIGSTLVAADGSWSFTPEKPLADGNHALDVVITDPSGNVSLPSDPVDIIIDTSGPVTLAPLGLEDLLPADSELSTWSQMSLPDSAGNALLINTHHDDGNPQFDDLLNGMSHTL